MKKGFTIVEFIVSFTLTMVIAVFLFQIIIILRNLYTKNSVKTELLNKQFIISEKINHELKTNTLTKVSKCGENCLNFIYINGRNSKLIIDYSNNTVSFGDYKTKLTGGSYFKDIQTNIIYAPTFGTNKNNAILNISIPMYNDNLNGQNLGVNVVHQYNYNLVDISTSYHKGDINMDGFIDNLDMALIQNYIGVTVTTTAHELADINDDKIINSIDVTELGKLIDYTTYQKGDVNMDGIISEEDVTTIQTLFGVTQIVTAQHRLADINNDGKINILDFGELKQTLGITTAYDKGDVNMDGVVDTNDVTYFNDFIGIIQVDTVQEKLADMNNDGIIDSTDLDLLNQNLGL